MAHVESITMSMREIDRLKTIQAVIDGHLRASTAASRLQFAVDQAPSNRLVQRYRLQVWLGGVTSTGPARKHQLPPGLADIALTIIRERYSDSRPTLACEKLREHHEIALAKETVRKLMTKAGLCIPRKQRRHRFTSRAIVGTDSENWCKSTAANAPGSRIAHLRARAGVRCSFLRS